LATSNKAVIVIDIVLKGLQNVDKLGKALLAITANKSIVNGFYRIYWAMNQVSSGAGKLVETLFRLLKAMGNLSQDPAMAKMFRVLGVVLKSVRKEFDKLGSDLGSVKGKFQSFDLMLGILAIQLRSLAFLIRDVGLNFLRFSQRVFAGTVSIAKAGADIEYSFANLQAILNVPDQSSESFQSLAAEIVKVGEATSFTINEVAQLAGVLAQAGLSTKEIEQAIGSVVQLAEAGGIAADEAAEIATSIMHMFSLQAFELSRVNDVLTATSIASNASVSSLANSFNYVGPLASSFGYSLEEVSAALGMLANAGQVGTRAGAGLAQVFSQLTSRADKANEILASYGSSFDAIDPSIRSITEILQEFERINFSSADAVKLFGDRAQKTFLALRAQGSDTLKNFTEMNKQAQGLAESIQEIKMDTVQGDVAKLNAAFEALKNSIFTAIEPQIRKVLKWLTEIVNITADWVRNSQEAVTSFFDLTTFLVGFSTAMAGAVLSLSIMVRLTATLVTTWSTLKTFATAYALATEKASKASMWSKLGGGGQKSGIWDTIKGLMSFKNLGLATLFTGLGTVLLKVLIPALLIALPLLALLGTTVYLVVTNWDMFAKKIQWIHANVVTPFLVGLRDGFTTAFYNHILPAMERWRFLMDSIFSNLGKGDWQESMYSWGTMLSELFGHVLGFAIDTVTYMSLASGEIAKMGQAIGAVLVGIPKGLVGDPFGLAESMRKINGDRHTERIVAAINDLNDVLFTTSDILFQIQDRIPSLEAVASKVMRFNQLSENELKDLKDTMAQLGPGAFNVVNINKMENDLKRAKEKVKDEIEAIQEAFNLAEQDADPARKAEAIRTLREKYGVKDAQSLATALAKANSLISEMDQKLQKLQSIKTIAKNFADLGKFGSKEDIQNRVDALRRQMDMLAEERKDQQAFLFQQQNMAVGGDDFESEVQKNEAMANTKKNIVGYNEQIQAIQETINFLLTNSNDILANQNLTLEELIQKKLDELAANEKNRQTDEARVKLLEEQKQIQEELNRKREEARRQDATEGLDDRSKQKKQDTFDAEDDLLELQKAYDELQAKQDAFLEKGLVAEADAVGAELNRVAKDMDAVQARIQRKQKERDDKYRDQYEAQELDMKLRLAEEAKNQAQETALFTQKFNEETEKMIKDNYFDATTGKETGEAANIRALRQQELANELEKIKAKYDTSKADQDVADKAKEVNDVNQKGLQILLDKVKNTADLIALQRALFKIQEMYDSKALENARRAQNAEQTLNNLMMKRAELAAKGQSTAKLDELIKRRTETAKMKRGIADRSKRQAGIGDATLPVMDHQAMNNLTAAISANLENIRLMLVGMDSVFAAAASSWVDKFVEAWNLNSNKITDSIRASLTNAVSGVVTGDLFTGVPATGTDATKGGAVSPINVTINGDNPEKIWRGLERKLNQLKTQNA
jgi:TP901 family phage tail tape measure protein